MTEMKFSLLTNKGLYTYSDSLISIVKIADPEVIGVKLFYDNDEVAHINFSEALLERGKTKYAEILAEKDDIFDDRFIAFRDYIKVCSRIDTPGWTDAANKIMDIIRKYGWSMQGEGYKTQVADFDSLTTELDYPENQLLLRTIDGGSWYEGAKTAGQGFKDTFLESLSDRDKDLPTLAETRQPLIETTRELLSIVHLRSKSAPMPELDELLEEIELLNAKTMSAARSSHTRRTTNNEPGDEETPENNPDTNKEDETGTDGCCE